MGGAKPSFYEQRPLCPAVRGQGSAFWKITGSEAVPAQVFEGKRGSEAVPRNMLYKQKGYRNIKDRAGTGSNRLCFLQIA